MSFQETQTVDIFDDETGVWRPGQVCNVLENDTYFIHYFGWSKKNDEVVSEDRIRQSATPPPPTKRVRKTLDRGKSPGAIKFRFMPETLIKEDKVLLKLNENLVNGTVTVNDPIRRLLTAETASGTTTLDYENVFPHKHLEDSVCSPIRGAYTPTCTQRRETKTRRSATKKDKRRKEQTTSGAATSNPQLIPEDSTGEVTQMVLGNSVIFCGCFLKTSIPSVYDFVIKIELDGEHGAAVSGYSVREVGENTLMQIGYFERKSVERVALASFKLNAAWQARVVSTQMAAEERVQTTNTIGRAIRQQRKVSLRGAIVTQIRRALSSKARQIKFVTTYTPMDADFLGLNLTNGFSEEYSPESFNFLDRLLGETWDFKMLKGSDRYSFVTRFKVELKLGLQQLNFNISVRGSSAADWNTNYRADVLNEIMSANCGSN